MLKKEGIPKEILEELDISKKKRKSPYEVTVIVEPHQTKIPIPRNIRLKLGLKKGSKCSIIYDEKNKEVICKFK